jgi:hypothetical protein
VPAICQSPKSLRATTAELDDLRAPLLGIVRAASAFCVGVGRPAERSRQPTESPQVRDVDGSPQQAHRRTELRRASRQTAAFLRVPFVLHVLLQTMASANGTGAGAPETAEERMVG